MSTSSRDGSVSVCFFSLDAYHFFNPGAEHAFGGAELQLHLMATRLARDPRFDVSFIVGDYGQPREERKGPVRLLSFDPHQRGPMFTCTAAYYARLLLLLRRAGAQVYVQRTAGVLTFAIALFCRLFRRRFVYMVAHDEDLMIDTPPWYGRGLRNRLGWIFFTRGLRMADLVVVQHETQKEELLRLHGKEGVIRRSAHPMPAEPPAGEREFHLWVGRCEPWKRPGLFLDLAAGLPEEEFVMVCPPARDRALFDAIRERADRLSNVRFLAYVPHREIASWFRRARTFVNTSRREGFPNTFVEAAREGTPVLSLAVDPDEDRGEHSFGRVFDDDPRRLREFLAALGDGGEEWRILSRSARLWAQERHDIEKIRDEDRRLFLALAGKGEGR